MASVIFVPVFHRQLTRGLAVREASRRVVVTPCRQLRFDGRRLTVSVLQDLAQRSEAVDPSLLRLFGSCHLDFADDAQPVPSRMSAPRVAVAVVRCMSHATLHDPPSDWSTRRAASGSPRARAARAAPTCRRVMHGPAPGSVTASAGAAASSAHSASPISSQATSRLRALASLSRASAAPPADATSIAAASRPSGARASLGTSCRPSRRPWR